LSNTKDEKKNRKGLVIGVVSLALAVLAYVPSAAAFVPAIILSILALFGAILAALFRAWRTALITAYTVGATVIASPIFFPLTTNIEKWMVLMGIIGMVFSIFLYTNYTSSRS
jgi:hypothetical protein